MRPLAALALAAVIGAAPLPVFAKEAPAPVIETTPMPSDMPAVSDVPNVITVPDMPKSGDYTLDKGHANLTFRVNHLSYSYYLGRFNEFDAKLTFDAKNPANSKVTATLTTASVDTNNEVLEGKLKADDWLDAKKFPAITFVSKDVKITSATGGTVTGDLTLHGVTKPVTLDVTLVGYGYNTYSQADTVGFSATGKLNRSDFGITNLVPKVGDEVTFTFDGEFNLIPAAANE